MNKKTYKPRAIKLSLDTFAGDSVELFNIRFKPHSKTAWCQGHGLWVGKLNTPSGKHERVFTPIVTRKGSRLYWMDAITGSLYDNAGACMTSVQLTLDLDSLVLDKDQGTHWLMERKSYDVDENEEEEK